MHFYEKNESSALLSETNVNNESKLMQNMAISNDLIQNHVNCKAKKKKKVNSNQKGKRGEREWVHELWDQGFLHAYRTQQHCGKPDPDREDELKRPDVMCPTLPKIHFEVKYVEKLNVYEAIDQANRDCGKNEKLPIVAWRKNKHDWLVIMKSEHWFKLLKESSYVESVFCPGCKSHNVVKNGQNYKQKSVYLCKNQECERTSFVIEK